MRGDLSGAGASDGTRPPGTPSARAFRRASAAVVATGLLFLLGTAGTAAAQDAPGGSLDPSFADINPNQEIRDVLVQPDGKILVSGLFTQVAGQPRSRVARLNPDGTIDPTFANPQVIGGSGLVETMALQPDGKILIGGNFASVQGQARFRLARLNPDGSLDAGFNVTPNGSVFSVAVQSNGKIVFGGSFTQVNGSNRNGVARLNSSGSVDSSFAAVAVNLPVVYAVAPQPDGKVVIGGNFTKVDNTDRSRIARLTIKGQLDSTFTANANEVVYSLAVRSDGKIFAGGNFGSVNFVPRNRIALLNSSGSVDQAFPDANPNAGVEDIAIQQDGKVLFGGVFTQVGSGAPARLARLSAGGSLDSSFTPQLNGSVSEMALQPDGKVVVVGFFTQVDGVARYRAARLFGGSAGGGGGGGSSDGGGSNGGNSNGGGGGSNGGGPTPTPADALNVSAVRAQVTRRNASVSSRVQVSGEGTIAQQATTGSRKVRVRCRARKTVSSAATSTLKCRLGSKARRSLRKSPLKLTLTTTFTPEGGTAVTATRKLTIKRKR